MLQVSFSGSPRCWLPWIEVRQGWWCMMDDKDGGPPPNKEHVRWEPKTCLRSCVGGGVWTYLPDVFFPCLVTHVLFELDLMHVDVLWVSMFLEGVEECVSRPTWGVGAVRSNRSDPFGSWSTGVSRHENERSDGCNTEGESRQKMDSVTWWKKGRKWWR